jgi:hypothetical protein
MERCASLLLLLVGGGSLGPSSHHPPPLLPPRRSPGAAQEGKPAARHDALGDCRLSGVNRVVEGFLLGLHLRFRRCATRTTATPPDSFASRFQFLSVIVARMLLPQRPRQWLIWSRPPTDKKVSGIIAVASITSLMSSWAFQPSY